jgi:hypothetical protein
MMKIACVLVSICLWLGAASCRAAEGGIATIVEGDATMLRGTSWFKLAEGVRIQEGDVIEAVATTSLQVELFDGGSFGVQGPATLYIATLPSRDGKLTGAAEFYLPKGWLKLTAHSSKSDIRVRTPLATLTAMDAVAVIRSGDGVDIFIESGNARLSDPGRKLAEGAPAPKAGEFWSRSAVGRPFASAQRPPPAFLTAMPKQFMVTMPGRIARFQANRVDAATLRDASFADAEPWLATPYRAAFVNRFQARLKADPAFQKAAEPRLRDVPEWDKALRPAEATKPAAAAPPAPVPVAPPPPPAQKGFLDRLFDRGSKERERGQ